ncbi:MAG: TIGR02453 family protein, partial [Planctomycetales bacterium]|nr:TIGR02453 family protein [Planctomycetales bacterium]
LAQFAPMFRAVPKKVGGSLMRIHRDTRFAKDKSPYKTNVGIQFRHEMGGDVHAPGFYLHIEPGQLFLGAGSWHPAADALALIRAGVDERPQQWRRAVGAKAFRERYELAGDALKRPPRDFDPAHPLIEDLKRKDFIGIAAYDESALHSSDFVDYVAAAFKDARPLVRFLCESLRLPY